MCTEDNSTHVDKRE